MDGKIAVVGLGALFPEASTADVFWRNVLAKRVSIRPLPESMFESEVFYRPELIQAFSKQDKSVTRIAGWIDRVPFDTARRYKIPPSVVEHMDDNQQAALYVAGQALEANALSGVSRDRIAVVFGNGMVGTRYGDALFRVQFQLVEHHLRKHPAFQSLAPGQQSAIVEDLRSHLLKDTIPITEDSAPGVLPNLIAGRIANVFDFHGPSFAVDAACASVLAAVITGVQGLQLREYDAVVCGGADMPLKHLGFVLFSAINALSPDGSYPFDARANGFVMSQGAGAVTLKRLADAVRDGDDIHAVITGYGQASDGKGKYIAAPNADWQARAIENACRMAGYPADTIELVEAHGTATRVGDVVEVVGLKQAFRTLGAAGRQFCGLTSVKSNIGHLKSAAGIAGLIKAVLAIRHGILPPTASFTDINPKLALSDSPFYVLDQAREWSSKAAHPRRANVSSFGFGGADYHLALEQYRPDDYRRPTVGGFASATAPGASSSVATSALGAREELVLFSADSRDALDEQADTVLARWRAPQGATFADACLLHNYTVRPHAVRLAVLASTPEVLAARIAYFRQHRDRLAADRLRLSGIFFREGPPITPEQTAVLFPGQASQYPGMLRTVHDTYDAVRTLFRKADAFWLARRGRTVTSLVFPAGAAADADAARDQLKETQHAHPSIFVTSFALFDLLRQMGLDSRYLAGHSLGEITALAAAGRLTFADALRLVEQRGYAFVEADLDDPGAMLSLAVSADEARRLVEASGTAVSVANCNSPRQTVVAGASPEVERFRRFVEAERIQNKVLYVSHAFHTPMLRPVAERFLAGIESIRFRPSAAHVMMSHEAEYYPATADAQADMPGLLRDQILAPVDFVGALDRLYRDGVRLFVEVGPGSILSSLARETLPADDVRILTANHKSVDDWTGLQRLLAGLFAEGVAVAPIAVREVLATPPAPDAAAAAEGLRHPSPALAVPQRRNGADETVVYSGVAIGLPGSYKSSFRDDNFEQLFEGRNLIERLTDDERQRFVDLRISKLVKDETGPTFKLLTALDDVIQLAGKIGRLDLIRDYHIDEKTVQQTTSCIAHGVAAGYEALRDARIPLVREYVETSTGRLLPHKLALPATMQDETGVIFANGFPLIDPVIQEVSRHVAHVFGSRTRRELVSFYEGIVERVRDPLAKKLLTDWFVLYYGRLTDRPGEDDLYQFNHQFMTRISAQANNLLATLLNARGPNFQLNAACSSTSNAITIAEDFIRSGRVKRMLVVGADDPTSKETFPLLGAGFLSTGAATNGGDLYTASVPFDRRRNGMIVGAGAVGIVVETEAAVRERGVRAVCELVGTHAFNAAKHMAQIDSATFSRELDRFVTRMEERTGLRRSDLARRSIYLSHETSTPPRGGCSQTEADALRTAFGEDVSEIIVGNTKGMTGHTMGASLEDAVAAKALQFGKCPPVVNYAEPDPMLQGLQLWRGGQHDRSIALKMSAGFGSQGHFALLRKVSAGDDRIADAAQHTRWLAAVAGHGAPTTAVAGRVLVLRDRLDGDRVGAAPTAPDSRTTANVAREGPPASPGPRRTVSTTASVEADRSPTASGERPLAGGAARVTAERVVAETLRVFAEVTKYGQDVLDLDMDMEADLGIDTVKQATILAMLGETFRLEQREGLQLSSYPTIRHIVNFVLEQADGASASVMPSVPAAAPGIVPTAPDERRSAGAVVALLAEMTGYPPEMLEPEMECGADLGLEPGAQRAIAQRLTSHFGLDDGVVRLSDDTTVGQLIHQVTSGASPAGPRDASRLPEPAAPTGGPQPAGLGDVVEETLRVVADVTKYGRDMLDLDMNMEADLGIDTVKQATILARLGEKYRLEQREGLQLSSYPTIRHIVEFIVAEGTSGARALRQPPAPQPAQPPMPPPEPTATARPSMAAGSVLSRQVVRLVEAPQGRPIFEQAGRSVWVVGDDASMVQRVADAFAAVGAAVRVFVFPASATPDALAAAVQTFARGEVADLIVDCTHIGGVYPLALMPVTAGRRMLWTSGAARFIFFKALAPQSPRPAAILCLTAIDGRLGLDPPAGPLSDPTFGALSGFYKGLRKEWPGTQVRILDLDPRLVLEAFDACVPQMLAESSHAGVGVEVAYAGSRRMVAAIEDGAHDAGTPVTFDESDTFLITGGGSGIAAHVALGLAKAYPASFVIVGRTALPPDIATLADMTPTAFAQVIDGIRGSLQAQHARVTPVMVHAETERLTRAIEVFRTIEALERLGRRVEYVSCDVRDMDRLDVLLAQVRRKVGPITAVVHAAGVDRSHTLDRKSVDEFSDVFSVKAEGALSLLKVCADDPLKLVVAFGSISGRFGNAAQLDYCAANSFLTYWVKAMRTAHPGAHVVSLVWSGWKDAGMAWRNEVVRARAQALGLNFIDVDQGVDACLEEIGTRHGDSEVIRHRGLDGLAEPGLAAPDLHDLPLIDRIVRTKEGVVRAFRLFSTQRDALIDQHRLGSVPILPAVAYAELAIEYFTLQAGRHSRYLVRGMTFNQAFKLFREEPRELFIEGQALSGSGAWAIEIKSSFRPPRSESVQTVLHSCATVSADGFDERGLDPAQWTYHRAAPISLPAEQSLLLVGRGGPDQRILLGPLYNDVHRETASKAPVLIYPQGTTYPAYFPLEQLANTRYPLDRLLINPCFLDSIYQACAAHLLVTTKRVYLPWEVAELGIVYVPREEGMYTAFAQVVETASDVVGFDVVMKDSEGRLCYFARGVRFRLINL